MSNQAEILMIDDERHISAMTRDYLQAKGFHVTLLHHAHNLADVFKSQQFDLCILDILMPMKDGYAVAEEIRDTHGDIPILFLTARTDTEDRVKGLRLGAEDYITKPYSLEELELRILNVLRRSGQATVAGREKHMLGAWEFDPLTRLLTRPGESFLLTTTESRVLELLCSAPDGILSRDHALAQIWDDAFRMKDSSLKVYISKLRKYFEADPLVSILNVHGVGYRLVLYDEGSKQ